jgi:hypothetical protein
MIIQIAIVGHAFCIAHWCIYMYIKDFTLNSAVFVCECICEQSKTLENLLRVFVCDVISFLLFLCTTFKKEKARETPYRRQLFTTTFD